MHACTIVCIRIHVCTGMQGMALAGPVYGCDSLCFTSKELQVQHPITGILSFIWTTKGAVAPLVELELEDSSTRRWTKGRKSIDGRQSCMLEDCRWHCHVIVLLSLVLILRVRLYEVMINMKLDLMTTSQWWCIWRRWSTLFVVSVTWEGQATTGAACTWHHCCGGLSLSPSTLSFSSTSSKQASVSSQCDPCCRIRNDRAVVSYDINIIIQSKFTNCILFQRRSCRFSPDCCILFFFAESLQIPAAKFTSCILFQKRWRSYRFSAGCCVLLRTVPSVPSSTDRLLHPLFFCRVPSNSSSKIHKLHSVSEAMTKLQILCRLLRPPSHSPFSSQQHRQTAASFFCRVPSNSSSKIHKLHSVSEAMTKLQILCRLLRPPSHSPFSSQQHRQTAASFFFAESLQIPAAKFTSCILFQKRWRSYRFSAGCCVLLRTVPSVPSSTDGCHQRFPHTHSLLITMP